MTRPRLTHMPHMEARRKAEAEARQAKRGVPVVDHCSICGSIPAPFGYAFGALHACMDRDCRAEAETRAQAIPRTGRAA